MKESETIKTEETNSSVENSPKLISCSITIAKALPRYSQNSLLQLVSSGGKDYDSKVTDVRQKIIDYLLSKLTKRKRK